MSGTRPVAVPLSRRSVATLALASVGGLMMFLWPLLLRVEPTVSGQPTLQPPFLFLILLPVLVVVVLAEVSEGGLDPRVLAILGALAAVNALARALSPGLAGVELTFFLLVLAGRVFGPGFGFVLGAVSLFASALLTAGVGPWLPYQMLCAAWVGMGAGLLPRRARGRAEIALLVGYAVVSAYLFGALMNLSSWPFALGVQVPGHAGSLAYAAGDPLLDNLRRFGLYTLLTSTGGWDTMRAITNATAIVVLGPAVLVTLRRASRRALVVGSVADAPETPPQAPSTGSPVPASTRTVRRPEVSSSTSSSSEVSASTEERASS